jgi:hypothetical protein
MQPQLLQLFVDYQKSVLFNSLNTAEEITYVIEQLRLWNTSREDSITLTDKIQSDNTTIVCVGQLMRYSSRLNYLLNGTKR